VLVNEVFKVNDLLLGTANDSLTEEEAVVHLVNNLPHCEISSFHGGEYDVQSCLLGCTAV
jgi:hypothetical protein